MVNFSWFQLAFLANGNQSLEPFELSPTLAFELATVARGAICYGGCKNGARGPGNQGVARKFLRQIRRF